MQSMARILVADDHAASRASVRFLLSGNPRWQICGEATNGKEAIEKVQELKPDLVLLDITMPVMSGIEATREIRRIAPGIKILIFTLHESPELEVAAQQAGADAVVTKADAAHSLTGAVERLAGRHFR